MNVMSKIGFPLCEDTSSISEYIEIYIKTSKTKINSIESLAEHITGYLELDLEEATSKKKLQSIFITSKNELNVEETKKYYIKSGVYISPWVQSLLTDNDDLIQGYLLDTTWKIMSSYVTSIMMGSSYSVGIPLAFAFGRSEEKKTISKTHRNNV